MRQPKKQKPKAVVTSGRAITRDFGLDHHALSRIPVQNDVAALRKVLSMMRRWPGSRATRQHRAEFVRAIDQALGKDRSDFPAAKTVTTRWLERARVGDDSLRVLVHEIEEQVLNRLVYLTDAVKARHDTNRYTERQCYPAARLFRRHHANIFDALRELEEEWRGFKWGAEILSGARSALGSNAASAAGEAGAWVDDWLTSRRGQQSDDGDDDPIHWIALEVESRLRHLLRLYYDVDAAMNPPLGSYYAQTFPSRPPSRLPNLGPLTCECGAHNDETHTDGCAIVKMQRDHFEAYRAAAPGYVDRAFRIWGRWVMLNRSTMAAFALLDDGTRVRLVRESVDPELDDPRPLGKRPGRGPVPDSQTVDRHIRRQATGDVIQRAIREVIVEELRAMGEDPSNPEFFLIQAQSTPARQLASKLAGIAEVKAIGLKRGTLTRYIGEELVSLRDANRKSRI